MFIKFKGKDTKLTTTSIIEQKLFRQGESAGWLLSLHINGNFNAPELDSMLTEESISEITLVGESEVSTTISGYQKVTSCVVRYSDENTVAEIQLTKGV